ncbi:MFS general substrate transporter [Bimuria novae-zelandiae CBS 107.79]|uniref:MFS general substrate transporter n=1 Tax=Bimuria novae-zelandiae CBS 107.79 TaxID=1447943 RepID=A0A6A5VPA2_9PLEO|nr:MFS general substrate transporter [Bimuria novae-zelandiae CBS 107.79]
MAQDSEPQAQARAQELLAESTQPDHVTPEWKPSRSEWLVFLCLALISLIVSLDSSIIGPALPSLALSLHGTANETFWTGTSYLVTCAIFQPFIVSLSDAFGRRQLLFLSVSLFSLGTVVCCIAQNFRTLLAGRSVQGVGGGGALALVLVVMTDVVPLRQRPKYYSLVQMAWAVGLITGPITGGAIAEHTTWRWIFYINFPFCFLGLLLVPFVIKLKAPRASLTERLLKTDWLGAFLFISSTCSFLIGITWGGTQFPWGSWRTIVPIAIGAVGMLATLCFERYAAPQPFLRVWLFRERAAMAAYACAVFQGLLMFSHLYYLPLYLQSVHSYTPTLSGAGLIPIIGILIPTSVLVGTLITRWGTYTWAIWLGWTTIIASTALLIVLSDTTPTYAWILVFLTIGPSHGLVLTSLNFSLQALAKERDGAYAAAMYTFMRSFGMCLGVAVGGTVFTNRLVVHLAARGLDERVARDAEAFIVVMNDAPNSAAWAAYRGAYAEAFRNLFEVLLGVAVVAGAVSVAIKHASMDRALDSEHMFDEPEKRMEG